MIKYIVTDGAYKILSANIFDSQADAQHLAYGYASQNKGQAFCVWQITAVGSYVSPADTNPTWAPAT